MSSRIILMKTVPDETGSVGRPHFFLQLGRPSYPDLQRAEKQTASLRQVLADGRWISSRSDALLHLGPCPSFVNGKNYLPGGTTLRFGLAQTVRSCSGIYKDVFHLISYVDLRLFINVVIGFKLFSS